MAFIELGRILTREKEPAQEKNRYIGKLKKTTNKFVPSVAFSEGVSRKGAIGQVNELLNECEVDIRGEVPSLDYILMLAVADGLHSSQLSFQSSQDLTYLLATGTRRDKSYGTLSRRIQQLSDSGDPLGRMFDPNMPSHEKLRFSEDLKQAVRDKFDADLSEELNTRARQSGPGTLLHPVRSKLGVNPKREKPFRFIALDNSGNSVSDSLRILGLYKREDGMGELYVCNGSYDVDQIAQHEAGHHYESEGGGFSAGQGYLMAGITEGITEECTATPTVYEDERRILHSLIAADPSLKEPFFRAYMGDTYAQPFVIGSILREYGLSGLLALSRMRPGNIEANDRIIGPLGQRIYIPPWEVDEVLIRQSKSGAYVSNFA